MFPVFKFFRALLLLLILSGVSVVEAETTICDTINRILVSGIDPKDPFAATDALILPNAIHCENFIEKEDATYRCDWGLRDEVAVKIRDMSRELKKYHIQILKGYMSREEYEKEKFRINAEMNQLRGGSEEVVSRKHKAQWVELHSALDNCFDSGAIQNGDKYRFGRIIGHVLIGGEYSDITATLTIFWQKERRCGIFLHARELFESGVRLEVKCPKISD